MEERITNEDLLEDQLPDFQPGLPALVEEIWGMEDYPTFLKALTLALDELTVAARHYGQAALDRLEEDKSLETHILNFRWPEKAKSLLILWRDITLQHQKAHIFYLEHAITERDLAKLKEQSKAVLSAAIAELKGFVGAKAEQIRAQKSEAEKVLESWDLQQPPFGVYADQFKNLKEQNNFLQEQYRSLRFTVSQFDAIIAAVGQNIEEYTAEMEEVKQYAAKVTKFLDSQQPGQFENVTGYLEEKIEEINIRPHLGELIRELDKLMSKLPLNVQIPIDTAGGLIRFRPVNLQRAVRQWLDAEIMPLLYKIEELSENTANGLKMALLNISNRAQFLQNESRPTESDVKDLSLPIGNFLTTSQHYRVELDGLAETIASVMEVKLRASAAYDPKADFLQLPLSSTVNQFTLEEYPWLTRIWLYLKEQWNKVGRFQDSVRSEGTLSDAEKIVRFVQARHIAVEQSTYTSIFQAKGYIGESFVVGRTAELERIGGLIDQWKQNYRGAVILSGQRFSGKTLFGELVAKRFLQSNLVRLNPNSSIQVGGRRFETSHDLGAALEFIRKYTVNEKVLIWLDDLELWKDPSIDFNRNIHALCRYIDNYSRQFFFLVSMSNWLKAHLALVQDIDKVFQAEINLDTLSAEDIRKAILIRHGATQKRLVDKKGEQVNPAQFRKLVNTILRHTENNIGESLLHWAFSVRLLQDNKIVSDPDYQYRLPDIIDANRGILLSALMMEKITNEYSLRRLFGLPFKLKYQGILQRLMSLGLLSRYPDGSLEINEMVVNDIGRMLERKNYLKFHRKS